MLEYAWVLPATMFASFWLILFFGKRLPKGGHEIGVAAIAVVFVLSLVSLAQWHGTEATLEVEHGPAAEGHEEEVDEEDDHALAPAALAGTTGPVLPLAAAESEGEHEAELIREPVVSETDWFSIGGVDVRAGTHIDGFAVVMLVVVASISLAVHVFSTNYMHDDVRYTHFFAALSLFTCGMLVLVTSSNLLQMLFGWELMGACSFMLIGHWWEEKPNSDAALKAFFTTRTGDVGLLVGMSILFWAAGRTFDIATINGAAIAGDISDLVLLVAAASLLVAVIGKSAQFPLHTWLPDAMAGPTPVSALIHAATMVVAGVYLVARLYGVFWTGFDISAGGVNPVALVGGVTLVIAAVLAFVQSDIKKVLAYSTISQLGYMVMALGVGAWTAGIFHLFTHAFFKALLFLAAGSVSHAVHSFDMKKDMGGLRAHMPITFATFIIGSIALAGLPPFAGFWSKDEILLGAAENGYRTFEIVGLAGAFMTACYMTRCVYLTFFGEFRGHGHPHESPKPITIPLIVLAGLSMTVGLLQFPGVELFTEWTDNQTILTAGVAHHAFEVMPAVISTVVVLAGIGLGVALYWGGKLPAGLTERSGAARAGYRFLANRYYLDALYTDGVVAGIKGPIARVAYWVNQHVIDAVANGAGVGFAALGRVVYDRIDQGVVDGAVNLSGTTAGASGGVLRTLQSGRVQQYGALLFGAAALLALALVVLT